MAKPADIIIYRQLKINPAKESRSLLGIIRVETRDIARLLGFD
jgi:hypothetical protein